MQVNEITKEVLKRITNDSRMNDFIHDEYNNAIRLRVKHDVNYTTFMWIGQNSDYGKLNIVGYRTSYVTEEEETHVAQLFDFDVNLNRNENAESIYWDLVEPLIDTHILRK